MDEPEPAWSGRAAAALSAIVMVPLVVALVSLVTRLGTWYPAGDLAVMELTTRDVGVHSVLLGPYSRFGWHHPGPALFYLLAVPYRLMGGSSIGLSLGAAALNLAAVAGIAVVAWRRGGAAMLVSTLLSLELLFATLGPERLRDPWNPLVTILPFALFLLAVWSVACGDRWWLPLCAAIGTLLVQSHLGYVLSVVGILGVCAVVLVRSSAARERAGPTTDSRSPGKGLVALIVSAGVAAPLWAPAVWEQLTRHPGNLTRLLTYTGHAQPSWSMLDGAKMAVTRFGALPAWLMGQEARLDPHTLRGAPLWPGILTIVALVWVTGVARRRQDGPKLILAALVWVVALTAVATGARIEDQAALWLLEWMAVGGFAAWALVGVTAIESLGRRRAAAGVGPRRIVASLALVTALVATGNATAAALAGVPQASRDELVSKLWPQVDAWRRGTGLQSVRVTFGPSDPTRTTTVGWGAAIILQLERAGATPSVDPAWADHFGERLSRPQPADAALTIVTEPTFLPPAEFQLVAQVDGVRVYRTPLFWRPENGPAPSRQ